MFCFEKMGENYSTPSIDFMSQLFLVDEFWLLFFIYSQTAKNSPENRWKLFTQLENINLLPLFFGNFNCRVMKLDLMSWALTRLIKHEGFPHENFTLCSNALNIYFDENVSSVEEFLGCRRWSIFRGGESLGNEIEVKELFIWRHKRKLAMIKIIEKVSSFFKQKRKLK